MTEAEYRDLRARLLTYPGIDEDNVEDHIADLEDRAAVKAHLMTDQGFSNARAEAWLDRTGRLRPPGWHSVFFYPDSSRPRNRVVFWILLAAAGAWWFWG